MTWITVFYDKSPAHVSGECIGDCLEALSPEVFCGDGVYYCDLTKQTLYWDLQDVFQKKFLSEKLRLTLQDLHQRLGLHFRLSPTPPWQGGPHPQSVCEIWNREDLQSYYETCPLSHAIKDQECLEFFWDMGFDTLGQWLDFTKTPQAREHVAILWGQKLLELVETLEGTRPQTMTRHQRPLELCERIYASREADLFESLNRRLQTWETRLHARKSQLRGFRLCVRSEAHRNLEVCEVPLHAPTRSADFLNKLLVEKMIELCGKSALLEEHSFADHIEWIELKSLGICEEVEKQLSLFEFDKEVSLENWNALLAKLSIQNTTKLNTKIETAEAQDSWRPEQSFRWVSWRPDSVKTFKSLENHYARPVLLLKKPEPCLMSESRKIKNEEGFWKWVESESALSTLEHIEEAGDKRLYARIQNTWVFWEETHKQVYVHGWF